MLSELSPQAFGSVSRFLVLAFGGLGFAVMGVGVLTVRFGVLAVAVTRAVVLLVEFLGFLPIVAFAGHEGNGGKRKEHRENFHRAPSIAARRRMAKAKFNAPPTKSAVRIEPTQACRSQRSTISAARS
jgi:hypothetical protein